MDFKINSHLGTEEEEALSQLNDDEIVMYYPKHVASVQTFPRKFKQSKLMFQLRKQGTASAKEAEQRSTGTKKKKYKDDHEYKNECSLHCAIARYMKDNYPDLFWTSRADGANVGKRTGGILKLKHVVDGLTDISIMERHGGYSSFEIELKTPKGTGAVKKNQHKMHKICRKNGSLVIVDHRRSVICKAIDWYCLLPKTDRILYDRSVKCPFSFKVSCKKCPKKRYRSRK